MIRLVLLLILLPFHLPAQNKPDVNEISSWFTDSEQVKLSDSLMKSINEAKDGQHIPEHIMKKNMIMFKALFNPGFDVRKKLKIAAYIEEHFREYPDIFPIELVFDYKKQLLTQLK